MLPASPYDPSSSNTLSGYQPNFSSAQSFSNSQVFLPLTLQDHSLHQGTDPNSPNAFKQNIEVVQEHVARLRSLARSALVGIQNAYHPGKNPGQTEADFAALKQTLQLVSDIMRHTGIGAFPLLPMPVVGAPIVVPTEQQLMAETNRAIQALYEKLKRSQESAAVVANLLGTPEQAARSGR